MAEQNYPVHPISSWIQPAGTGWTGPSIQPALETIQQAVRNHQQVVQTHQSNVQIFHQAIRQRGALIPDLRSAVQQFLDASRKRETKRNLRERPAIMFQFLQVSQALDDAYLVVDNAYDVAKMTGQQMDDTLQALMSAVQLVSTEYQRAGQVIQVSNLDWQNVINADQAVLIAINQGTQVGQAYTQVLKEYIQVEEELEQIFQVMKT